MSSIFLMCLADRVLAYGDCAIVPNPTAEQLADIAISSARTAAQFGIEPRVAMLSYSTGTSGTGADVEKVRTATELVRERAPDLLVEGPIQYDAAVEPSVAATKMPDSPVAGRATVLIFPDLNTGNNTYKAVQRSAGAVAIGPVLQGLNKPVNDLSRGALVADIVNTVAITAIQAQGIVMAGPADEAQYRPGAQLRLVVDEISTGGRRIRVYPWQTASLSESAKTFRRRHWCSANASCAATTRSPTTTRRCVRCSSCSLRRAPSWVRWVWRPSGTGWCTAARCSTGPTLVDDALIAKLGGAVPAWRRCTIRQRCSGIEVARRLLPDVPHVAVFDTAFFHDLPAAAATYAIDRDIAERWHDPPVRIPRHVAPVRAASRSRRSSACRWRA